MISAFFGSIFQPEYHRDAYFWYPQEKLVHKYSMFGSLIVEQQLGMTPRQLEQLAGSFYEKTRTKKNIVILFQRYRNKYQRLLFGPVFLLLYPPMVMV